MEFMERFSSITVNVVIALVFADSYLASGCPTCRKGTPKDGDTEYSSLTTSQGIFIAVGSIVGTIVFISILWAVIRCCRKDQSQPGTRRRRRSADAPKEATPTASVQMNVQPPPYTAQNYSQTTAATHNSGYAATEDQGHQNQGFSLDVQRLPVSVPPVCIGALGTSPVSATFGAVSSDQPPSYEDAVTSNSRF